MLDRNLAKEPNAFLRSIFSRIIPPKNRREFLMSSYVRKEDVFIKILSVKVIDYL